MLTSRTDGKAAYAILAVENEVKVNYAMPVKSGLYDFLQLAHQVTAAAVSHRRSKSESRKPSGDEFLSGFWKDDRLIPVVTVVIYFEAKFWDGPVSLKEMYAECSEEIISRAVNYRMNLITPKELSDDETDGFQTNMREIMRYIKYSDNRKMLETLVEEEQRFKSVERGAVEIINAATGSAIKLSAEKEMVDMCLAIQEMREESRLERRDQRSRPFRQNTRKFQGRGKTLSHDEPSKE